MTVIEKLQLPLCRENPVPFLHERFWFLPRKYGSTEFTFSGFHSESFFGNTNPVYIEYCSGNGAWVTQKAESDPTVNWIAVERGFDRARKIWKRLHKKVLSNLIVAWAEGHQLTKTYIPNESVDAIYINFPDPWPKRRHAKYRIIQKPFVAEMHRILKREALVTIVTDDANYSEIIIKEMRAHCGFQSLFEDPYYVPVEPEYGSSFFDELFRNKGLIIRQHTFKKL